LWLLEAQQERSGDRVACGFGFCSGEKWYRGKRSHFGMEWNATCEAYITPC